MQKPWFKDTVRYAATTITWKDDGKPKWVNEGIQRWDDALTVLVGALKINHDKLRMSHERVRGRLHSAIVGVAQDPDPGEAFAVAFRDWKAALWKESLQTFHVMLPLPLRTGSEGPPTWTLLGATLQPLDQAAWEAAMADAEVNLTHLLNATRHELVPADYIPYAMEVEARDLTYATQYALDMAQALLGLANLAAHINTGYPLRLGGTGAQRWSNLRTPFVVLTREPGARVRVWREDDEGHRHAYRLIGRHRERHDQFLDWFPDLDEADEVTSLIIEGLRHYQSGMTSANHAEAFAHFWRGVENMAQAAPGDSSRTTLENLTGLIWFKTDPTILQAKMDRAVALRNDITHKGKSQTVEDKDIEFLALGLVALIEMFAAYLGRYCLADYRFMMKRPAEVGHLEKQRAERTRERELLDDLIKWRSRGADEEE